MLSSKQVLEKAGISRATLNNYIGLGLVPKPVVKHPESPDVRARRLGYFPNDILDRLVEIDRLKRQGLRIADIASELGNAANDINPKTEVDNNRSPEFTPDPVTPPRNSHQRDLNLTIESLDYPAYLVNNNFEIEWANEAAEMEIFGKYTGLPNEIADRSIFRFLLDGDIATQASRDEALRFHLSIAKNRLTKTSIMTLDPRLESDQIEKISHEYDAVDTVKNRTMLDTEIDLSQRDEAPQRYRLYASFFREGVFFAYAPPNDDQDSLLALLSRRDLVIRDLLRNRKPYMTPLAVLVADIQSSVKICAELPPEEYFELVNQVWGAMEPIFRKYYATHGKHVGDGMVYYFFPQPDCNYVLNAIQCSFEMKEAMKVINQEWKVKKNWANTLLLNTGLDEGQEWFGAYQTPTHLEFTVLGDTINRAARLSDFAKEGAIWVTKNILASLSASERDYIAYGIRRYSGDNEEIVVQSTYGRISNLIDLDDPKNQKLLDIAALPVTEVMNFSKD